MKTIAGGVALWLMAVSLPDRQAQDAVAVSGIVRDGVSNRPIANVRVQLVAAEAGVVAGVATGDDGVFVFPGVKPGVYVVVALKPPYAPASVSTLRVTDRAVTTQDIALMPGAVITGRVIDAFGQPAAGAEIGIRRAAVAASSRIVDWASWQPMWTDERGGFRFSGLAAGEYLVFARAQVWMEPKLGSTEGPDLGVAAVYFSDAVDIAQAEPLRVAAGQERTGVDIRLRLSALRTVTGFELKPAEMHGRYASIRLRQYRPDLLDVSSQYFSAEPTGSGFRIRSVPPGHYWLTARADPREPALWAAAEVVVGDADVSGVTLSYLPASSVAGRVVADGQGEPGSLPGRIQLSLVPMAGTPPAFYESWAPGVSIGANGDFTFSAAVPGRHQVRARAGGVDLVVVSVTVGEVTTAGDVLDVASGSMKGVLIRVRERGQFFFVNTMRSLNAPSPLS